MAGLAAGLCLFLLGACSGTGNSDNPVARSLGWFPFLDGSDMRRECRAGSADRYRFVYNGKWGEQVRIYEIERVSPRLDAVLAARVIFPETLTSISSDDPLAPWRGSKSGSPVPPAEVAALDDALRASGFEEPAPNGLVLHSDGTYWVAIACRGGAFHYNAFAYPSKRFAALIFPQWLLEHDRTGVALLPPREGLIDRDLYASGSAKRAGIKGAFDLEVGDNGLKLVGSLF